MFASCYLDNLIFRQALYNRRLGYSYPIFSGLSFQVDTALAVLVEPPCPNLPIYIDSKGMIGTSTNCNNFLQAEFSRNETIQTGPFNDTTTKLILLTITPCENSACAT